MEGEDNSNAATFFVDRGTAGSLKKARSSSNEPPVPENNTDAAKPVSFFFDRTGNKAIQLPGTTKKKANNTGKNVVVCNKKVGDKRNYTHLKQESVEIGLDKDIELPEGNENNHVTSDPFVAKAELTYSMQENPNNAMKDFVNDADKSDKKAFNKRDHMHLKQESVEIGIDIDFEHSEEKERDAKVSSTVQGELLKEEPLSANNSDSNHEDEVNIGSDNEDLGNCSGLDAEPECEDGETWTPINNGGADGHPESRTRRPLRAGELKRLLKHVAAEYWDWAPISTNDKRAWIKKMNECDRSQWHCKFCNVTKKGGRALDQHLETHLHAKNEAARILKTTLAPRRPDATKSHPSEALPSPPTPTSIPTPPPNKKNKKKNKNKSKKNYKKRKIEQIKNGGSNINGQPNSMQPASSKSPPPPPGVPLDAEG